MNSRTHRLQFMDILEPQKFVNITYADSQVYQGALTVVFFFIKYLRMGTYPHRLINAHLKMFAK